jgi:hypothetical protein
MLKLLFMILAYMIFHPTHARFQLRRAMHLYLPFDIVQDFAANRAIQQIVSSVHSCYPLYHFTYFDAERFTKVFTIRASSLFQWLKTLWIMHNLLTR